MRRLATYLYQCWQTTIAIRERRSAMSGLISALLSFPLMWLLGGTIELTATGLWWLALWASTSAAITLLIISPFHVWSDQKCQIDDLQSKGAPTFDIQLDQKSHLQETYFGKDREDRAIFVSVLLKALPAGCTIKGCQGYLDKVWELGAGGDWCPTPIDSPQSLLWASEGQGDEVRANIDGDAGRPLNIFFRKKRDPRIHLRIPSMLNRHKEYIERGITRPLKLDMRVIGESAASKRFSLRVELGDEWTDIKVTKLEGVVPSTG
jgi:hypothetical protein